MIMYFLLRTRWRGHAPCFKRFLLVFIPSLAIVSLPILTIKTEFPVARPCVLCTSAQQVCNPYCEPDPSFPSGHAGAAFVAFTSLWLVQKKRRHLPIFILHHTIGRGMQPSRIGGPHLGGCGCRIAIGAGCGAASLAGPAEAQALASHQRKALIKCKQNSPRQAQARQGWRTGGGRP